MSALHVIGVRHHSPACARLVEARIRAIEPARVLVEGPSDMNERLDELALGHRLPVAIYSYAEHEGRVRSSWTPFTDYSPEWVALAEARALGAGFRFIDLPAWAQRADEAPAERAYAARLARSLGLDGADALWDHLFEQPLALDALEARLWSYFRAQREAAPAPGPATVARERFMAAHVAHALREDAGPVLVVCGGYHAPRLARARRARVGAAPPPAPRAAARHGSYLVPFSFARLDAFGGYAAGMPSPAFYQAVWERGAEAAGEAMLARVVAHLRARRQRVATADLVALEAMARGLMRLRGHDALARTDLCDALASALVHDALD
ncbi:MAG: hypothetical protein KF729_28690, partial [Sandaracinaceae bacterium]|nr:hypothetical protein [Sandaracinaceae bacterium]